MDNTYYTTWASAQYQAENINQPPLSLSGNSIRQIIHTSKGGDVIRIKFSNLTGEADLSINEAHIAEFVSGSKINIESDRVIYFNGKKNCSVPAGKEIWSDPVNFKFNDLDCLTVTTYFQKVPESITGHMGSRTNSYMLEGKHLSDESFPLDYTCEHWYVLAAVEVVSKNRIRVISCFGDSITDGRGSTTDKQDRWTDVLSQRLIENDESSNVAAINEGIGGTLVAYSGVSRFDQDVINLNGIYYSILFYGINDIVYGNLSAESVIKVYKSLINKAHENNIIIYGATLLPFGNFGEYSEEKNESRIAVNEWIKNTSGKDGGFDAFIDLDAVIADPENPKVMKSLYDCGDGLHPSAAGYKAIGEAFDLQLFCKKTEDFSKDWNK